MLPRVARPFERRGVDGGICTMCAYAAYGFIHQGEPLLGQVSVLAVNIRTVSKYTGGAEGLLFQHTLWRSSFIACSALCPLCCLSLFVCSSKQRACLSCSPPKGTNNSSLFECCPDRRSLLEAERFDENVTPVVRGAYVYLYPSTRCHAYSKQVYKI